MNASEIVVYAAIFEVFLFTCLFLSACFEYVMQQTGLASYGNYSPTICRMFVTIEKPNLNANSRVFGAETTTCS